MLTITYLLGGGYHEICCAIQNMVGNVTGMVCDGAKADCALKISTCVNAACQAAAMGTRGVRVQSTDGIVEENVERTLDNFAILSTHGTSDSVILDLMLNTATVAPHRLLRRPNFDYLGLLHQRARPDERPHRHHPQCRERMRTLRRFRMTFHGA